MFGNRPWFETHVTFLLGARIRQPGLFGRASTGGDTRDGAGDRTAAGVGLGLSRAIGIGGVLTYNWWAVAPFIHGMITSTAGFFSDFSADGEPHASVLHALDLSSGLLILAALLLRRWACPGERRREWPWLMGFGVAVAIGGRYSYACPSSLDLVCRARERSLMLPLHHYVHMGAGVAEFAFATVAIYVAAHPRTGAAADAVTRTAHMLLWVLLAAYPVIGFAYLQDRWGVFVEPIFFAAFSVIVTAELLAPAPPGTRTVARPGSRSHQR